MRSIILVTLALGVVIPTPSDAQSARKASQNQAYNSCVDLARQRGWTESDISGNRGSIRNFITRCMQGRGARAQQQKR